MLKIWGRTNSINVQKALWCCAELNLPFERVDAGMAFGIVEPPAYRTLNPNGRIPAIEDDGYALWESNTIVRYLSMKHGLGSLCPSDLLARFDAEHWMDWQLTTLDRPLRTVFWALGRANDLRVVPTLIEGLSDPDDACQTEARNALRFISKRIDVREPPDDATAAQRAAAIAYWKKWYLTVRPYDERDDLGEAPAK